MPTMSSRGRGRRTINEINMVPFIDVMLVLLIIFMVTAPLITPSMINLPSVGKADRSPDRFVQVLIDKDARLQVKDGTSNASAQDTSKERLVDRVRQLQGSPGADGKTAPVVISADKNVKYETVVDVMDRLQRAGVERVGLSVQTSR
ncbi:ExbD/TolR family protein [Hydrogenophaga sp. OTU3427]|uniref:ExbD/TolR family protein n=1 Tax=Hydrogenophaga sp. OTU3427 TaxID=3043856 RepID=UPI00313CA962